MSYVPFFFFGCSCCFNIQCESEDGLELVILLPQFPQAGSTDAHHQPSKNSCFYSIFSLYFFSSHILHPTPLQFPFLPLLQSLPLPSSFPHIYPPPPQFTSSQKRSGLPGTPYLIFLYMPRRLNLLIVLFKCSIFLFRKLSSIAKAIILKQFCFPTCLCDGILHFHIGVLCVMIRSGRLADPYCYILMSFFEEYSEPFVGYLKTRNHLWVTSYQTTFYIDHWACSLPVTRPHSI